MIKIGGYIVECVAEDYNGGWRAIVAVSHAENKQRGGTASARYAVPAVLTTRSAAEHTAVVWAYRLVERNRESIELALDEAELDETATPDR